MRRIVIALVVSSLGLGLTSMPAQASNSNHIGKKQSKCVLKRKANCSKVVHDFTVVHHGDLRKVNFRKAHLHYANFAGADLRGADFRGASLRHVDFTGANLTGAVLTGASLTGANFSGATYNNTTCHDGTNSDNNGGTCAWH